MDRLDHVETSGRLWQRMGMVKTDRDALEILRERISSLSYFPLWLAARIETDVPLAFYR